MFLRAQAQQLHAHQWVALKDEGASSFSFGVAFGSGATFGSGQVREVEERQRVGHWFAGNLHRLFSKERKGGTKTLMSSLHCSEGPLKQIHSKRAFQANSSRNIVKGAIRL